MKEQPILFSAPMVRAILSGSKSQTRRIVKPQPAPDQQPRTVIGSSGFVYVMDNAPLLPYPEVRRVRWDCPYGQPGDRLWVRETWAHDATDLEQCRAAHEDAMGGLMTYGPYYRATESAPDTLHWRPSIHMPRWASRITLEVTSVRVERLQDISRGDAMAEGCPFPNLAQGDDPRRWYAHLWDEINGPGSWEANPWVWVVEFRTVEVAAK